MSGSIEEWVRPSERVFREIEAEMGVGMKALRSKSRAPHVVFARQAAMYRLHDRYGWAYNRIGRVLGYDHTTVMHSIGKHALANSLPAPQSVLRRATRMRQRA